MKRTLKPRPQQGAKGGKLAVPITIGHRMNKRIQAGIDEMIKVTERELTRLFERDTYAGNYGMAMDEENIGKQARMLFDRLWKRFEKLFDLIAWPAAQTMITAAEKSSAATLAASLNKAIGEPLKDGLKPLKESLGAARKNMFKIPQGAMTAELKEVIAASTAKNVALIKRVPKEYLGQIETAAYQAITSGRGLADLKPVLERQGVTVKNWAHNVSLDQTRKVYQDITAHRMQSIGVDEYEWVHTGGSGQPRQYHRDVLNGNVFSLSNPPVIQKAYTTKKGKTYPKIVGKPSDLPFCRCQMRPIVSFKKRTAENAA